MKLPFISKLVRVNYQRKAALDREYHRRLRRIMSENNSLGVSNDIYDGILDEMQDSMDYPSLEDMRNNWGYR